MVRKCNKSGSLKKQKGGFLPLLAMGIPMLLNALKGGKMVRKNKRKVKN